MLRTGLTLKRQCQTKQPYNKTLEATEKVKRLMTRLHDSFPLYWQYSTSSSLSHRKQRKHLASTIPYIYIPKYRYIIFNQVVIPVVMLGLTLIYNFQGPDKEKETNQ